MLLPERHASDESYRYGFQGSEKDNELKGEGNSYTTHFRQYDSRLGRWLSIDPVTFPSESPYMAMVNNPINYNDVDGDCPPCAVWAAIKGGEIILGLIVSYAIYDQRENIRDGAGMLAESTYNATVNLFSSDPTPSDVVETFPVLTRPALEIETFPTVSEKLRSRVLEELLPVRESTQINEGYNSLPLELQLPNIKSIPAFKDENFNHSMLLFTSADISWKGFSKGKLKIHSEKHGEEFGDITQAQYLNQAKEFANEVGNFMEETVGNFIVKYDPNSKRIFIGHVKSREIRTFYTADDRSETPYEDAIEYAKELSGTD